MKSTSAPGTFAKRPSFQSRFACSIRRWTCSCVRGTTRIRGRRARYARRHGIPLERVESHVERDDSEERKGKYVLKVKVAFHGPLSDADRQRLEKAVAACPIHKLMTMSEVVVDAATEREK